MGLFPQSITEGEELTLLNQQLIHFQQLVEQHPFPLLDHEDNNAKDDSGALAAVYGSNDPQVTQQDPSAAAPAVGGSYSSSSSSSSQLDPLTALMMEEQSKQERLQELDLRYRKERARRNRGATLQRRIVESEEYDENAVTLQIIDKDLHRLPSPSSQTTTSTTTSQQQQRRRALLRQVLFVYHCTTHPTPGYRQGMHEIASYLLHALEQEQEQHDNAILDDDNEMERAAAHTFALLCAVLEPMQPAFDVVVVTTTPTTTTVTPSSPTTGATSPTTTRAVGDNNNNNNNATRGTIMNEKQPLVALGRRILQWTGHYHPTLLLCLQQQVQVPPQLYLTKWIRLLYSRELQEPRVAVLPLWDFWFQQLQEQQHKQQQQTHLSPLPPPPPHGGPCNLLHVLEAPAVARLLLHAPQILSCEDPLHHLMNLPQQSPKSIAPWQTVTMELMQGKSTLSHVILTPPPPQPLHQAPPGHLPPPRDPQQQQQEIDVSGNSLLWNNPLSTLTATTACPAAAANPPSVLDPLHSQTSANTTTNGSFHNHTDEANSNQLFSSLSAGLKQTIQQAKSRTQSISKRIYHEWEQAQQQQQMNQNQHYPSTRKDTATASSSYNIFYRDSPQRRQEFGMDDVANNWYDMPATVASPPVANNNNSQRNSNQPSQHNAAELSLSSSSSILTMNLTVIQSFLTHVEQEKDITVPATVWQAMADLQQYAVGGPMVSSHHHNSSSSN